MSPTHFISNICHQHLSNQRYFKVFRRQTLWQKNVASVKVRLQLLTSSDGLEVQIPYRILDDHRVFRQIEGSVCQRDFYLIHLLLSVAH